MPTFLFQRKKSHLQTPAVMLNQTRNDLFATTCPYIQNIPSVSAKLFFPWQTLKRECWHLTQFSSLVAPKFVILTTFGEANDENFIKMTIFPFQFQWMSNILYISFQISSCLTFCNICLTSQAYFAHIEWYTRFYASYYIVVITISELNYVFLFLMYFSRIVQSCFTGNEDVIWLPSYDDVIKWKHFPRNWPFVRGIHRSPVNSPHKGQWRRALMFSLICVWINDWVNNREAGDLRRYRTH